MHRLHGGPALRVLATTPYHFLNQAELSAGPSEPEVGLPYGSLNVTLGVQHLQLLGVKYFMAETPQVEQEAAVDPDLQLVAKTGPWTYNYSGANTHTTWNIYLVKDSPLVTPLANDPVVLSGVKPGPASWLGNATQGGPGLELVRRPEQVERRAGAERAVGLAPDLSRRHPTRRSNTSGRPRSRAVTQTDSSLSFHVSRVGTPVLVKVSYFPNWHASGADGPWRVTPNLMVVVPTSHDVTLTYGASSADHLGLLATLIGLIGLMWLFVVPSVRRRFGKRRGRRSPDAEGLGHPRRPHDSRTEPDRAARHASAGSTLTEGRSARPVERHKEQKVSNMSFQ